MSTPSLRRAPAAGISAYAGQYHFFDDPAPLPLECGEELKDLSVAYFTYGELNAAQDNAVWICHALTANADAADWWSGLVGPGKLFDPAEHFIVCANMLGSCYGTTGPLDEDPDTHSPYYHDFPDITIRDIVAVHERLRQHLGIERIHVLIGGSMGGQQALEWAVQQPQRIDYLIPVATNARHSAWGIAFNETQRMALEADPSFYSRNPEGGAAGMAAARAVALLSYRSHEIFEQKQTDPDDELKPLFRAGSYQRYQGKKLVRRFNAHSYFVLSRAMDSHHLGRGRGGLKEVLAGIRNKTLLIGITSDILFPLSDQRFLAAHIPGARFAEISSDYGHDGFLIEGEALTRHIRPFLQS